MDDFKQTHTQKRKRLENQFKDGVRSPPKIVSQIVPAHGSNMAFSVPSTQKHTTSSIQDVMSDSLLGDSRSDDFQIEKHTLQTNTSQSDIWNSIRHYKYE
ncbi:hypothetical protein YASMINEVIRUS_235 [Yasminevirus sp. GU-2018]|uniref:Uncharacterized protein n=1 Tax=Yasminevirus sp. GU-2018 TaxID=2420051 RepID=A0A5K0U8P0_9VIRU|nr:hypothetical protein YASMINEVIRUS_235 [Yasminevirus sp. GU-2018]